LEVVKSEPEVEDDQDCEWALGVGSGVNLQAVCATVSVKEKKPWRISKAFFSSVNRY